MLLGALMFLPAGYLRADGAGMALDCPSGGTGLVFGTAFSFMANGSGSGNCHTDPNLVFANASPNDWFNLLVTAAIPVNFMIGPLTCDPGTYFVHCTTLFDSSAQEYSAFFFGEDDTHPGIQMSVLTENGRTNEFGFVFSGFPANQHFDVSANVPESSSLALMLAGIALVLGAVFVRTRLTPSAFRRTERTVALTSSASPR